MAEFKTVMKEIDRMCRSFTTCAGGCPLHEWHRGNDYEGCYQEVKAQPEAAEKIIMRWVEEHPAKTKLQKFRELFPNAPLCNGIPTACPAELGWATVNTDCANSFCFDCWSRPYEDQRGESRDL